MTDHTPTTDLVRHGRAAARGLEPTAPGTSRLLSDLASALELALAENERLLGLKNDLHAQYVDTADARVHAEIQRDEARAALANRIEATS